MENAEKKSVISLKSLGASLALLVLAILLTAGVVFTVLQAERRATQANREAQAQQSETRNRLARAHEDEREIRAKIVRYQEILRQGRTQPERRLDWVETLRGIRETRRLLGLDYEISPQKLLDDKNPAAGGYDFLASPMKLDLPLLHEDDLLGLLTDLGVQVKALISVRQCSLQRIPLEPSKPNAAGLKATCEIDWITLREKT
jgi:hypothetical protein